MNLSEFIKKLQNIEAHDFGDVKIICNGLELTEDDIFVQPTDRKIFLRSHIMNSEDYKKIEKLKKAINKAIEEFEH